MAHGLAQVFSSMSGHQNQLVTGSKNLVKVLVSKMVVTVHRGLQRIDNRVTGD